MALTVSFMNCVSPPNKISKEFTGGYTTDCSLKDNTSMFRPVLLISSSTGYPEFDEMNYLYLPAFKRYYFIDDIISVGNNLWEIHCHVDVLYTYKEQILNQDAVIRRQQTKYNLYLNDPDFMTYNNDSIVTKKFSDSEFNKVLNYVLVVNGS